ncbi:MAG: LptF/LptG family permease [Dinghuibacter sp.]|nr:LptF/LptG family permease [Dinghuibacter sp.]
MFGKLDKLILRTFIGPFIVTFFIALFVVVIQFFWKYIDEMVGKGIDFTSLVKMVGIVCLQTGILFALPIAVLLSSLITFGNLGESFELVAIKSSGISLLRFMRPVFFVVALICCTSFLFNNYILPQANLKFYTMLQDIRFSKPAFDLKAGEFYKGINGYAIKVGSKDDKKNTLKNIVIYENSNNAYQDNLIVADSGIMKVSANKQFLEFRLFNGWRFQEKGVTMDEKTDFIRIGFREYNKMFDISDMLMRQTPDSVNKGFYKMLNLSQLNRNIDSLSKTPEMFLKKIRPTLAGTVQFLSYMDTGWKAVSIPAAEKAKSMRQLLPDSIRQNIGNLVAERFNSLRNQMDIEMFEYKAKNDSLRFHKIEWHRKFTFSFICMVMFLIGAPLGSIVRRGGLGTPLLLAVTFFVIYFIILTLGEKSANTGVMRPITGMWLPVMVLLPVGLFLTRKAMQDSQLFSKDFYYRNFRWLGKLFSRKKTVKTAVQEITPETKMVQHDGHNE